LRESADASPLRAEIMGDVEVVLQSADVDAIVEHVGKNAQGGDLVCVFSNGGFGGIHRKLLERLNGRR